MHNQYRDNIRIANIISDALESHNIIAFFQPIYDNKKERIFKYECLARIRSGKKNIMPPASFIDIAGLDLANIYYQRSDKKNEIITYKQMIKSDPDNTGAREDFMDRWEFPGTRAAAGPARPRGNMTTGSGEKPQLLAQSAL